MSLARAIPAILRTDLLRLVRDRFLLGAATYVIGVSIALRWLIPWVTDEVAARTGFDLAPYHPLAVSYFGLVNAALVTGIVAGFLLLEQREERTIQAVRVTPTPLSVPIATLGASVTGLTILLALVETTIVGQALPPWPAAVAAAILVAPTGVVMGLLTVTFASNKVEAFAVLKITGLVGVVPLIAWFVPEPWQYLLGVAPPYWACRIWWSAVAGTPWLPYVAPAVVVSAVWIGWLARRLQTSLRG